MSRKGAIATLVLCLTAAAPTAGQEYFELVPRRGGVAPPAEAWERSRAAAEALGIPTFEAFVHGTAHAALDRTGHLPVLVIPTLFADSPEPDVPPEHLQQVLFDGPSPSGTVSDFYQEASGGVYDVSGTVVPWVRTSITLEEAAGERDGHGFVGPRIRDHVLEALALVDPEIDFGEFDNDGPDGVPNSGDDNGFVDAVVLKFIEVAGSCGGPGPWPHFGPAIDDEGIAYTTDDTQPDGSEIFIPGYIIESAVECSGDPLQSIGVMAHELGHAIGLPDLYRAAEGIGRTERHWVVGCFDLMAAGAWGCGSGPIANAFGPSGLSPLMKQRLGWLTFEEITSADEEEFVLEPVQTSGRALRIPLAPGSQEAFIIEYRPRTGFDEWLPDAGVLVYHHDTFSRRHRERPVPEGLPPAYGYHLVEADGDDALRRTEPNGGDRGVAEDVFAADGGPVRIDDSTDPSTRDHLGGTSTLTIHSIRVEGGVARVVLSVGSGFHVASRSVPATVEAVAEYTARLELAQGTAPYDVALAAGALPDGLEVRGGDAAVTIAGSPLEVGRFRASLVITDAEGRRIGEAVRVVVTDANLDPDDVAAALAGAPHTSLVAAHRRYLDLSGNRNGEFDVGDMRAFLLRTRDGRH